MMRFMECSFLILNGAVEITGVYRSTHYTENFHYKIAMAHRPASSLRLMQ